MEKDLDIEEIGKNVLDSAYKVHSTLGPGLLESVYQKCLMLELTKRGYQVKSEEVIPVLYDGVTTDIGFRLDLLVEDCVIIENKVVDQLLPVHKAQLYTYLKLGGYHLGYLINWNVRLIKDGINRIAYDLPEPLWRERSKVKG